MEFYAPFQVRFVAAKSVDTRVQCLKVVVPTVWILLSFFCFIWIFFIPHYLSPSSQRNCYTASKGYFSVNCFLSACNQSKLCFPSCNVCKTSFLKINASFLIGWYLFSFQWTHWLQLGHGVCCWRLQGETLWCCTTAANKCTGKYSVGHLAWNDWDCNETGISVIMNKQ